MLDPIEVRRRQRSPIEDGGRRELTREQVERVDVSSTNLDSRVDDLEADQVGVEDERCRI